MKLDFVAWAALLLAALLVRPAQATTYYVSLTGDESNPTAGYETGYRHPQDAVDAAVLAGTSAENPATILVDDGTYEALSTTKHVVKISSSYINLRARNSRKAVFDALEAELIGIVPQSTYRAIWIDKNLTGVTVSGFVTLRGVSTMSTDVGKASHIYAASGLLTDMDMRGRFVAGAPMVYLLGTAVVSNFTFTVPSRNQYNSNRGAPSCIRLAGNAKLYNGAISNITVYSSYMSSDPFFQAVVMTSAGNLMRNCLVMGNTNGKSVDQNVKGGGIYASAGTIESCTVIGNTAYGKGGGIYVAGPVVLRNNIVWGNKVLGDNKEGADIYVESGKTPTIEYCDSSTGITVGENGNVATDPRFGADGVTPATDAVLPGVGLKQDWMIGEKDLAGNPRIWTDDTVTPGAYEPQGRVTVFADFATAGGITVAHAPFTVNFTSEVSVEKAGTTYTWTYGDGSGLTNTLESAPSHTYLKPGKYTVSLSVTVPGVGTANVGPKEAFIIAGSDTLYVSPTGTGTDPTAGYATGFTHPQAAINEARVTGTSATSPATIYVDDGTYEIYKSPDYAISNRVVNITSDGIRLVARNSRKAILDGMEILEKGDHTDVGYRPLTIASGLEGVELSGFVITRGTSIMSMDARDASSVNAGSGLLHDMEFRGFFVSGPPMMYLTGSTVVSNFTFTVPRRRSYNANRGTPCCIYLTGNARLSHGAITNILPFTDYYRNPPRYQAVYMTSEGCRVENCLISGHSHGKEKGRDDIEGRWNDVPGGAVYASAGTLESCTIVSNTAWGKGAGVYVDGSVALRNCCIAGNKCLGPNVAGGGVYVNSGSPTFENCTIVGNLISTNHLTAAQAEQVSDWGAGLYSCSATASYVNSLFWGNLVGTGLADITWGASAEPQEFGNNLVHFASELPANAEGCLVGVDPLIATNSFYRLEGDSPCWNAGKARAWCKRRGQAKDIEGRERKVNHVDIGCYELQRQIGLTLILR